MIKRLFKIAFISILTFGILWLTINIYIRQSAKKYMYTSLEKIPPKYTCIVLGAHVGNDGTPSTVLADRLNAALELYHNHKVKRFLLSGDHGRIKYDEVNNMKLYLTERGIPQQDIFLDHAGFDTYNSVVRAKEIFDVNDAIIVTQEFHLSRALYIANKKGLNVCGYIAPMNDAHPLKYLKIRESIACLKAFTEVLLNRKPHFLGTKIPITGDSRLSYD
jgi:SanA protein